MVVQLALNIVPASGEAFGGMYHASQMASVVKTILTAGTLLVFLSRVNGSHEKIPVTKPENSIC